MVSIPLWLLSFIIVVAVLFGGAVALFAFKVKL